MTTDMDAYHYELPAELIAQEPLRQRSDARLLVIRRATDTLEHHHVRDLPSLLKPHDCLVLNDTKVVPAALFGKRTTTGGRWQGLFIESSDEGLWRVLSRTRGKLQAGETITLIDRDGREAGLLRLVARQEGSWIVMPEPPEEAEPFLARVGRVPLPHYIRNGQMIDADVSTYQTVFAERPGAVAAPTAGLHFSRSLLDRLTERGIEQARLTLHVGLGTFRPIASDSMDEHVMHAEWGELTQGTVDRLQATRAAGGKVVAVGTTCVRVLETAARSGALAPFCGETDLFIRPPFEFHGIDALLTNFHLPRTTLLVLVRTFGGDELVRRAYEEAIREQYRFYSYGDAMLIL